MCQQTDDKHSRSKEEVQRGGYKADIPLINYQGKKRAKSLMILNVIRFVLWKLTPPR